MQDSDRNIDRSGRVAATHAAVAAGEGLLEIVWRRRWFVLLGVLLSLGLAVVYLSQATPIYTSTSRLYIEQHGPQIINDGLVSRDRTSNYLHTQAELIRSTPILAAAVEEIDAPRLRSFQDITNPTGHLRQTVAVGVGRDNDIINVSYESPYPSEAAQIVNAVVDAYVTYHSQQKQSTALEVLRILQREKDRRDAELDEAFEAMIQFRQEHGMLFVEHDRNNIIHQRLSRLSTALTDTQMEMIDARARYETARRMLEDTDSPRQVLDQLGALDGLDDPRGQEQARLQSELNALELRLIRLRDDLTEEHPAVRSTQARIKRIQDELGGEDARAAEAYLASTRQRLQAAEDRYDELTEAFEEQEALALELNSRDAEYSQLDSRVNRLERLTDILDNRIKEINVTEDTGALDINILEVARPEDEPTRPQRARILAMALVLGLMLGTGMALGRDWMDDRFRVVDEIPAMLGAQVLSVIPHIQGKSGADRGRIVDAEPFSDVAEAYRTLRTAIYFGSREGQAKLLLVTSPAPADGKSTSASNLAIAMAQADERVLLLDADFRKPVQHEFFDGSSEQGLSSLIVGRGSLEDVIVETGIDNLDLLSCGPLPPNPSEILNSQAFRDVLGQLAEKYDRVVIDAPPVLAVADARILAATCDLTLVVLRADRSTRRTTSHALDAVRRVGGHVLGVVFNDLPRTRGAYGYYAGYGYGQYGNEGNGGRAKANGQHAAAPVRGTEERSTPAS